MPLPGRRRRVEGLHDVTIYDCTLRDGTQGLGISLSLQDKLEIARRLDAFGVDWIEGGWPGSNPKDAQFFAAIREVPLRHARVSAFGSTRHAGIRAEDDANLRLLLDAETPTVALVAKAWDFHVTEVLRTTLEENLAMIADSVALMKAHGREVVLDAEHFFDGLRANRAYALAVVDAAAGAGADWVVLCDTNGGSRPAEVAAAVADVVAAGAAVGVHVHDDGGLATANTLAAVEAGAGHVQVTVNGYGERVGNANLCTVLPNLVLKLGRSCAAGERLDELTALSAYVDDVASVEPNRRLPFVGAAAFAHKGGIHVQAISIDPRTYEHVDPAAVGNERRILVSELSGRNNVIETARAHGLELDGDGRLAREVARKLKELESEGSRFEDAEASFDLLVRRASDDYHRPFEPRAYTIASRKQLDDEATTSTATAEVAVGGEVLRGEADGGGPVNALEHALRNALQPAYPALARIVFTDFRAQIAQGPERGRGTVRVRLTAEVDGAGSWTTVGSAPDLLHAAWLALVDSLEHAVDRRVGVEGGVHVERAPSRAVSLAELAPLLADPDPAALAAIAATDWRATTLDLADPIDRELAARATVQGAALAYSFGNFCAIAAHPDRRSVVRVNLVKGRPENQVGSVTTTRDRVDALFGWEQLPAGLSRERVLELMDDAYALGPMGFRGPAAVGIPDHLSSLDADVRTTQLIAPGARCPSNELLDEVLRRSGLDFLFITSANVSGGVTGRVEPAHYDLRGIQDDFGDADGIVLIGHRDEAAVRASYPRHLPMSTSILAFHRLAEEEGRPALVLERHGSLHVDDVRALAARHGFGLVLADGARRRLPLRDDARDEIAATPAS